MKKSIYILGINDGHLATAALIKNGEIIACVSEERFTGIKNQSGIPIQSINYCLNHASIEINDLDLIVFGGKLLPPTISNPNNKTQFLNIIYNFVKKPLVFIRRLSIYLPIFRKIEDVIYPLISQITQPSIQRKRIAGLCTNYKFPKNKIIFIDHHLSHIYSGLYASNFLNKNKPLLIFTCDGEGDGLSATVSIFSNNKLKVISKTSMTNSIGNLFRSVTKHLGMKPLEHEYKVMGLAAYVSSQTAEALYLSLKKLFSVNSNTLGINTKVNSQLFKMNYLDKIFKEKRFDEISYATQKLTENILLEWIEKTIDKTAIKTIILSGGVFMNVKANQKISEINKVEEIFIMPSCGDESNAIGAGFYGYKKVTHKNPEPIKSLYLGPEYSNYEIKKEIENSVYRKKIKVSRPKNMAKTIATILKNGDIVARSSGRMEWGARALGNRSILADPINLDVVQKINKAIKCRDFWMPFAPVIMSSKQKKYLINKKNIDASYMIITFDTTKEGKKNLKAAIHQYDKSARPQVIERKTNPGYYNIINEFSKITGRYGILNTSFNLHGFPIVNTPKDAIYTFINSELKYLVLEDYLIIKN